LALRLLPCQQAPPPPLRKLDDEAGTAKLVRERREAATPIVRAFGGRVVKTTGDGV
jgi:class 3 adenylate cyclase